MLDAMSNKLLTCASRSHTKQQVVTGCDCVTYSCLFIVWLLKMKKETDDEQNGTILYKEEKAGIKIQK